MDTNRAGLRPEHFQRANLYKQNQTLRNIEVKVTHLTYKRRYKVREISDQPASKIEMNYEEPGQPIERITIADFYQRKYNITLKYPLM